VGLLQVFLNLKKLNGNKNEFSFLKCEFRPISPLMRSGIREGNDPIHYVIMPTFFAFEKMLLCLLRAPPMQVARVRWTIKALH